MVNWVPEGRVERGRWKEGEREKGVGENWWKPRELYGPESHIVSLLQHSIGQSSHGPAKIQGEEEIYSISRWKEQRVHSRVSRTV